MLARCLSAYLLGFGHPVTVEVDLAPGLPGLQLVGLPDAAIQESRERVRATAQQRFPRSSGGGRESGARRSARRALLRSAHRFGPAGGERTTGCPVLRGLWCAGELGLDGSIRPCRGILAIACRAAEQKARALVVAGDDAAKPAWWTA